VLLGLVLALVLSRPAEADEPLVPEALSGSFTGSAAGFFICTVTATSPVDTPDCFLGYVVPEGKTGQGRLRAVGGGFQRSSNFTVLEEVSAEPGAFTVGDGSAAVDVTFPDLGRLRARLTAGAGSPGWASPACPRTVLAYALAAGASTVFPVAAVQGTLSRDPVSEAVALYEPPEPVGCFAYFTGPAGGTWRMSHPHSAGHRRFEPPAPVPARGTSPPPGGPWS
jgi:hypothetical protein